MSDFRQLLDDEQKLMDQMICCFCGNRSFLEGPRGGMCVNIECSNCGARFNWSSVPLPDQLIRLPTKEYIAFVGKPEDFRFAGGPKRWVPVLAALIILLVIVLIAVALVSGDSEPAVRELR